MTNLQKPIRRIARNATKQHGLGPDLVISLYPGAVIGIRELGRAREWCINAAALLQRLMTADAADRAARKTKGKVPNDQ